MQPSEMVFLCTNLFLLIKGKNNMNKQDWTLILLAMGIGLELPAEYKAASAAIAGEYYTSSDKEKAEFLRAAEAESEKVATMFQQVSEKLAAELAALEEANA